MFIAGEARLSAELSREQSNFFSIAYDARLSLLAGLREKLLFILGLLELMHNGP
jgi:hypothetical protein